MPDPVEVVAPVTEPDAVVEPIVEDAPAEEVDGVVPPVTPVPPKRSAEARINEITRQKHDALREAEYWKSKAIQPEKVEAKPATSLEAPDSDDFETTEDYIRALTKWTVKQAREEDAKEASRVSQEHEGKEAFDRFEVQAEKLRAIHEDFDDVLQLPVFSKEMQYALIDSDVGAELAYYLGTHPAEAKRLSGLTQGRMFKELGKLETKFTTPVTPPKKGVTAAPDPISPVKGKGAVKSDPLTMTAQEYYDAKAAGLLT